MLTNCSVTWTLNELKPTIKSHASDCLDNMFECTICRAWHSTKCIANAAFCTHLQQIRTCSTAQVRTSHCKSPAGSRKVQGSRGSKHEGCATTQGHEAPAGPALPCNNTATLRPNSHTYAVVWHHGRMICQIIRRTCDRPDRLHHKHKMRGNNTSVANSMPALAEIVTNEQYHSHHHVCKLPCVPVTSSCSLCQLRNVAVLGCMQGVSGHPWGFHQQYHVPAGHCSCTAV